MVHADMGPLVEQDRLAADRPVAVGEHDVASPAERPHRIASMYQNGPVIEPLAAVATTDQPDHTAQRPAEPHKRPCHSHGKESSEQPLPRERMAFSRKVRRSGNCRQNRNGQRRQCPVDRDDAKRQHEREHDGPQYHDAVEPMEGLAAQQQFEEEVENRQTGPDLQAVYRQIVPHGYRWFWFSMRSINSRSSSTEIFSSSTSAETAPR